MIQKMANIVGGGDGWASNTDGSIQIKTLSENDESVVFTNVPAVSTYGYMLYVDTADSSTPNTEPPKKIGYPTFTTASDGTYTVSYTITKVTAAQDGATCQLRIIK